MPPHESRLVIACLLALGFSGCLAGMARAYEIGHTTVTWVDPERADRQIPTEVFYPADVAGENVPVAAPGGTGFPVVAFGHGYLIGWSYYGFVWEGLVPEGYVVALPATEGELFPDHLDLGKDLAFVVGALQDEGMDPGSMFYGVVASTSAVGGHSMGGGASFLAAAEDPGISTLFNLAAAETNPSAISAAQFITAPGLLFSGSLDCVTPPPAHQIPMYDALASACKVHVTITGGSHCQFAASNFFCNLGESGCADPTITRAEQHALTILFLVPWLDALLRDDVTAWLAFQNLLDTTAGISFTQDCATSDVESRPDRPGMEATSLRADVFPNPFGIETTIQYRIPGPGLARVDIYSVSGRWVRTLVDRETEPGWHETRWDGRDQAGRPVASGIYLYCLQVDRESCTGRVLLIR